MNSCVKYKVSNIKTCQFSGTEFFHLLGSDPENSTVTYGIEGTDRFHVNSVTGVITVAAPIDREVRIFFSAFVKLCILYNYIYILKSTYTK